MKTNKIFGIGLPKTGTRSLNDTCILPETYTIHLHNQFKRKKWGDKIYNSDSLIEKLKKKYS